jgi:hypothetical protein
VQSGAQNAALSSEEKESGWPLGSRGEKLAALAQRVQSGAIHPLVDAAGEMFYGNLSPFLRPHPFNHSGARIHCTLFAVFVLFIGPEKTQKWAIFAI